jgi:pimeloyl-ACP methyl ester carboxylesterase
MPLPPLPELRFAEIPAGSQQRYTGDRFSYIEAGRPDAAPLVLLHGIGANALHWRFQYAELGERFRIVAWNAPGYMLSDNLRAETPTGDDYADALADFLAALGIGRFDLLANSFGTRVAQCFAARHGGRIAHAVFTGTSIARKVSDEERERLIAARAAQVARGGYGFGDRAAALLGSAASPETVAIVKETLRATDPPGFMQAARFGASGDGPPLGDGLDMPLLLVQGAEDRVTPFADNAARLLLAVPHAELATLQSCGHLPEVEMPDRVDALVSEFLAR